jgi:hypothetical protein
MQYLVIRGEYPFSEVIGMASGETPEDALADAIKQNKNNNDFFCRHPVVEPVEIQ